MCVDTPAAGSIVRVLKGVLGPDASDADAEASDEASKLDLNRDNQDGVKGAVTMDLAPWEHIRG